MKTFPSDMPRRTRRQSAIAMVLALSMLHGQVVAAALSLPSVPIFLGTVVPPNLMFTLDDSGSMFWTWLPDSSVNFRTTNNFRYSTAAGAVVVDDVNNYPNYATTIGPNGSNRYGLFTAQCNGAYFNPNVTYTPPVDANGVQLPNASYTAAWFDGMRPGLGTLNLSNDLRIRNGFNGGFYYQYNGAQAALSFQFVGGVVQTGTTFYQECNSAIGINPGAGVFTFVDVSSQPAAVQTNYANWFSYYRTRMLAMKSAAGRAFAGVNDSFRVGFMTINTSNNASLQNIAPFTPANKTAWYNQFYNIDQRGFGTPLRTALNRAGQLYQNGTMPGITGVTDPVTHECQKNFTLLSTDGKWNDGHTATGNRDATIPALPVAVAGLTAGQPWPFPIREGTAAASNTLADIALRYWVTDLRPGMANNVPADPSDPASWQHMTTYTLGFGVKGTLDYPGALPGLTSGATRWPTPASNADTTVDDLWHAGINGFGGYLSAQDPNQLVTSLQDMLSDLASRVTSSSSVAANTTQLNTGARIYRARFDSSDWSGQLQSFKLDSLGAISSTFEWDAGAKLALQAGSNSDSRAILTWNNGGVPFQWANLSTAQQTNLRTPPAGGAPDAAAVGQQRLEFLRGWSANEGTLAAQFRVRGGKLLGDIIDSSPVYVGPPLAGYSDSQQPGYLAYRQANANRTPVIYVGANDGMLHGFDASSTFSGGVSVPTATSGDEVLAYVPGRVFHKLSKLTSKTYNAAHQFYVNSSPMVGDADLSNGAGTDWRTVLVSGLAHGGQAFFALDVTNPNAFSEGNAASLALWEFTDADDADLGYTFNQPAVDPLRSVATQIVRMNDGKWAAIVGNGYNNTEADGNASTTGHAVLYILYLNGPSGGTWTQGTDYIKITTNNGTPGSPNGLSTPRPFDENGDGKVDSIYAGDLNGNLWKFDVSGATSSAWSVGNAGQPVFTAVRGGVPQPITSTPVVLKHPLGGNFITFGTGKFIETADAAGPFSTQSLYGVWDNPPGGTVALGSLVQQTITDTVQGLQPDPNNPGQFIVSGITYRTGSSNPVDYTAGDKGWYMDLPATGETVPFNPLPASGQVLYNTVIPSTNPCEFGGDSFIMALDPFTGAASALGNFDTNNDGNFSGPQTVQNSSGAQVAAAPIGVKSTVGITPTPNVMGAPAGGSGGVGSGGASGAPSASFGGTGVGPATGLVAGTPSPYYPNVYSAGSGSPGLNLIQLNGSGGTTQVQMTTLKNVIGRILWKEIVQ